MATVRSLKIKTSTCRRLCRELRSYEEEVHKEAAKAAVMRARGADLDDLEQHENVLAESRMMVPHCHKRLDAAQADLKATLTELLKIGEAENAITKAGTVLKPIED